MALLTQWTWIWANSGRWWRIAKSGVSQSMGLQRVKYYSATEQQVVKTETVLLFMGYWKKREKLFLPFPMLQKGTYMYNNHTSKLHSSYMLSRLNLCPFYSQDFFLWIIN